MKPPKTRKIKEHDHNFVMGQNVLESLNWGTAVREVGYSVCTFCGLVVKSEIKEFLRQKLEGLQQEIQERNNFIEKIENHEKEEWDGWKIVSDMLDYPDKTSKSYQEIYDFIVVQKEKFHSAGIADERKRILEIIVKMKSALPQQLEGIHYGALLALSDLEKELKI